MLYNTIVDLLITLSVSADTLLSCDGERYTIYTKFKYLSNYINSREENGSIITKSLNRIVSLCNWIINKIRFFKHKEDKLMEILIKEESVIREDINNISGYLCKRGLYRQSSDILTIVNSIY